MLPRRPYRPLLDRPTKEPMAAHAKELHIRACFMPSPASKASPTSNKAPLVTPWKAKAGRQRDGKTMRNGKAVHVCAVKHSPCRSRIDSPIPRPIPLCCRVLAGRAGQGCTHSRASIWNYSGPLGAAARPDQRPRRTEALRPAWSRPIGSLTASG